MNEQPEEEKKSLEETPTPPPSAEGQTLSVMDLMDSPPPTTPKSPPIIVSSEDVAQNKGEALTVEVPPETQSNRPTTPTPLYKDSFEPFNRPPIHDPDATRVSANPLDSRIDSDPVINVQDAPTMVFKPIQRDPNLPPPAASDRPLASEVAPKRPGTTPPTTPPGQPVRPGTPQTPTGQPVRSTNPPPASQQPVRPGTVSGTPTPPAQPVRPPQRPNPPSSVKVVETGSVLPKPAGNNRNWSGCLRRVILFSLLFGFLSIACSAVGMVGGYAYITSDLPTVTELRSRASSFETAQIFDRNGALLYSLEDPNQGNRTFVKVGQISQHLKDATIATEDSRFYTNPGFDPIAIFRAVFGAVTSGETQGGASTITQQLARALLLDEEERSERSITRKIREIILAAEMYRTYEKDEILELYLNEINYGNRAYGIQAAAETYFGKSAADLTLAEASLLAGLPQAPAWWDPFTNPEKALGRQTEVLGAMVREGYITPQQAQEAINEMSVRIYQLTPPNVTLKYPHFIVTVLQQLEQANDAQSIYRGGLNIYTTIDPAAQQLAENTLANHRGTLANYGANNGAMVVMDPRSGEILALVGSVDFNDETISGQVNMALAPRQPGSTIKPFVYLAAMKQGWTASTLIWDIPTAFPDGANPPYQPKNYDDEFHGPMLLRPSLGNSYNIQAVKAMEYVGVCNFIGYANTIGLTSLKNDGCAEYGAATNYGLALALGGGEIPPLEMATAYAIIANQGQLVVPHSITRITDNSDAELFRYLPPPAVQVIPAEDAYIISDILSDNNARQPEFGLNNNLIIPGHRVAVKTGTSGSSRNDVRDAWSIGFTPEVVTAVWTGRTDNQPVAPGASGYYMATPIWNGFMTGYLSSRPPANFNRPAGVVDREVCANSGTLPGPACGNRRVELFNQTDNRFPLDANQDFLTKVRIDLWTGNQANEACGEAVYEANFFNVLVPPGSPEIQGRERQLVADWIQNNPQGQGWAAANGVALPLKLPPQNFCDANTPRPSAAVSLPQPFAEVSGLFDLIGTAKAPNFGGYQIDYGLSHDPQGWGTLVERQPNPVDNGILFRFSTDDLIAKGISGAFALKLIVFGPDNPYTPEFDPIQVETKLPLTLLVPTGTPTATPTETPPATATATVTLIPSATATVRVDNTPTPLPQPPTTVPVTNTPEVRPTETVSPPTETPTPGIAPQPTVDS